MYKTLWLLIWQATSKVSSKALTTHLVPRLPVLQATWYKQPPAWSAAQEYINLAFTAIYGVEAVLKACGVPTLWCPVLGETVLVLQPALGRGRAGTAGATLLPMAASLWTWLAVAPSWLIAQACCRLRLSLSTIKLALQVPQRRQLRVCKWTALGRFFMSRVITQQAASPA